MRNLILCATLAIAATGATAQECIEIQDSDARLACYDAAAGFVSTIEPDPSPPGNWKVGFDTSALRDTRDVYLSTSADTATTCRSFGGGSNIPTLFLRCQENTTSLVIGSNCQMVSGHSNYGRVDFRIDAEPAGRMNMQESTTNTALGLWRGREAIPFIRRLLGKDKLLVRFIPFNQNPQEFTFDISGLDEAIAPLREECNW